MSRLLIACLAVTLLVVSPFHHAVAAPSQTDIQTQLQAEWDDFITRMNGAVVSNGNLNVAPSGTGFNATLPMLTVKLQTNNSVVLENVIILATPASGGTVDLKLTTPATIPQFYGKSKTGSMTIGQQNIVINVKPAGDTWQVQTINAALGSLKWQQDKAMTTNPLAPLEATIADLKVTGKPTQLQLNATDLHMRNVIGDIQNIGQLSLTQQPSTARSLRLSDVLALLTNSLPQLETGHGGMVAWLQGSASMTAHVKNLRNSKTDGKQALSIDDILLQNSLASITNNKLTIRTTGTLNGIAMAVPAAFANTAPQSLDFTGTVRNLPAAYLGMPFNTPEAKAQARAALASAGTQLQIDSLNVATKGGLKASGTGLLTATNAAPTYTTGTVTLNISNLQDTLTQLQQQMKSGGIAGNPGQAMMALMLLQGMGKANGNQTQYVINIEPNGQILLNDQDLTGLMAMAGVHPVNGNTPNRASPARAMPVAPVTSGDTPMSTWKKP